MLDAHQEMARQLPALLTVIVPRHTVRGDEIAKLARARGLNAGLRSQDGPPGRDTQIYVADTIGELGLIFRAAEVVFMGRSLGQGGGHNPIEPAKLGCAILHGPAVEDFADVYAELNAAKAAARVAERPRSPAPRSIFCPSPRGCAKWAAPEWRSWSGSAGPRERS